MLLSVRLLGSRYSRMVQPGCNSLKTLCHKITGVQIQPHGPTRVQLLKEAESQDYWCQIQPHGPTRVQVLTEAVSQDFWGPDTAAWSNQGAAP